MGKFYKILFALLIVSSFNNIIANNIPPGPKAQINTTNTSVCLNQVATITFSVFDGNNSNAPYTYYYTVNGGTQQSIISPTTNDVVTLTIPTGTAGTFIYQLTSVTDSPPSNNNVDIDNTSNIVTITVNPLPVVDFTYANNQCSGSSIQFNSVVSGNGPYTYSWNFGDGDTSSQQNPTHTYNSIGCGTVNYNVSLTVIDNNGCTTTSTKVITIKQRPDAVFKDNNAGTYNPSNLSNQFNNCNSAGANANYNVSVGLHSSSTCITSYSVQWGDGSATQTFTTTPFTHTYTTLGAFIMTITAFGNNGCSVSKSYTIKNESNPAGGLVSPGSTTNLCAPTPYLNFVISNWALNSPGTIYSINYGDNTPVLNLLQSDLINSTYYNSSNPALSANYPVPHKYDITSCPNTSTTATLTISNSCGTTQSTISPIIILRPPTPDFTNPNKACVNTCVTFTNLSTPAYNENCVESTLYEWDFGDGSGIYSITSSGKPNPPCHVYTLPGVYTITLTTYGYCGVFTKQGTICIEPQLSPQFTLNTIQGCSPLAVTSTNTTNLTNICPGNPTYQWNVNYVAGYCGSGTPTWSFTNGTSATSANPSFNFVTPGTYNVSVTMTNSCGAITSSVQNIIVKQPPTVTINTIPDYCGSTTINPTANVNSCSPSSSSLSYLWNFPGATTIPAGAINASNPSGIIYSLPGTYTISLTVTNECGSTTSSRTFTIKPLPTATISGDISVCQNATSPTITFTATSNSAPAPNTTNPPYIFTYNINGGSNLTVTSSTATATVSVPTNTVGTFVYNLVSVQYGTSPSCSQSMTGSATVIINPSGQVNQPSNQIVCNNTSTSAVNFATTNTGGTTSYAWSFDTNIGLTPLTGTGNIPSFTAVNTGTTPLTATITVTPTLTNGAAICVGSPKTFTITINPSGQVNQPTNQVVCNNTATTAVNFSTTNIGGTTSYAWSFDTNIGLTPLTGTGNIPSFTAVNTSTTPIVATITVTPTFTNGATNCIGTPKTFTITVNPSGQVNQPTNQVVCNNTATNAVNFSTTNTNGTTSYAWSINTNIGLSPLTGTGDLPSFTAINTGTTPITATITVTPTYNGTSICNGTSKTFTITVNPSGQVNQPTNQVVCNNTATNAVNFSTTNTVGTTSYAWSFDTNIGLIPLSGSGNIPSFTAVNTGTTPIVATITVTPTFTNGATNCIGTPKTFTITVNPSGQVNPIPNQTLCSNNSTTAINFTTNNTGGITNYNWTNSNATIGLPASGTGNINAFNVTNSTANPITATITVTPSFSNGTPSCSGPSQTFTITVNPSPAVNFSPTNQTICSGETSALVNLSSTTPGATFSWTATQPTGITGVIT
ncbi:PKD domain-containing protein, partial [uncultured Flavobacterium sp.]|uniref:beta strand repeat-containing protein n=1 Tax=uncultured Flavobacterium sp. TaxID=165435 RepID=UPI00262858B4